MFSKKGSIVKVGLLILTIIVLLIVIITAAFTIAHEEECNAQGTDSSGVGSVNVQTDKDFEKQWYNLAKSVGSVVGVSPGLIYSQIGVETGGRASYEVKTDNNWTGITWAAGYGWKKGAARPAAEGGYYVHFDTISDFAKVYANTVKRMLGNQKPKTIQEYNHIMKAHGYYTASEESYLNNLIPWYNQYIQLHGKDKDSTLSDATDGAVDSGESDTAGDSCSSDDVGAADGNILQVAKSLLGYFTYQQSHGVSYIGSVEHPNKGGVTDCSGFVWLVLKKAGYSVPDNMQWFTGTMESDAKGSHKWLKQIDESEASAGDVVIVNSGAGAGNAGHTAILEEKWKGDSTKIIEMGGGLEHVNERTFKAAFYGLNGRRTFARPVKAGGK